MAVLRQVKVPLAARLKAWWEGYDVREMEARLAELYALSPSPSLRPGPKVKTTDSKTTPPPSKNHSWNETKIKVSQYVWGEGYCGPGGPDHIIGLSKLLSLSPEMSMMVLGAGLGGPARVLAKEFGAWVTGYEISEELAAAGMELSTMAGLAKKAPILHYDPIQVEPFDRNFDRALSKDHFYTVDKKAELMRKVNAKLKVDSLFLVTDYVLGSEAARKKPAFETWKAQEPLPPFLITHDEETALFEKAGFSIRVNEDISEHYVSLISKAWAEVDAAVAALMKEGEEGKTMIEALLREAEFWSLRAKMMEAGDLQMWRILAIKNTPKTLSNW